MKKTVLILLSLFAFVSCNNKATNTDIAPTVKDTVVTDSVIPIVYPESLNNVFLTHGGLSAWEGFEKIVFNVHKSRTIESHEVDINEAKALIQAKNFTLGANKEMVWVKEHRKKFTQDPEFYKDFYYYFVAMPFVLASDEVLFNRVPPVAYSGVNYPGYKVSFKDKSKPVKHYYLYYNPKTFKLAWLGYTIPKKEKIAIVRYEKFNKVKGLLLPSKITWHKFNNGTIGTKTNSIRFSAIELSTEALHQDLVVMPENAKSF